MSRNCENIKIFFYEQNKVLHHLVKEKYGESSLEAKDKKIMNMKGNFIIFLIFGANFFVMIDNVSFRLELFPIF